MSDHKIDLLPYRLRSVRSDFHSLFHFLVKFLTIKMNSLIVHYTKHTISKGSNLCFHPLQDN